MIFEGKLKISLDIRNNKKKGEIYSPRANYAIVDDAEYAVTVWNQRTMTLAKAKNSPLNFSHEKAKYHIGSKLFLLAKKIRTPLG